MADLSTVDSWKKRLCRMVQEAPRRAVFVVGAGLSWDGRVGAWGVSEILKDIKDTYGITVADESGPAVYQKALSQLKSEAGAEYVEKTIRRAILAAAKEGETKARAMKEVESGAGLAACRALQNDPLAWNLPVGVEALSALIAMIESRVMDTPGWPHPCVLSTNFDGLLEAALQKRGIKPKSEIVAGDQFPHGLDEQVSIVHLHGFWLREPTLHDADALQARRPSLEAALRDHLRGAQVFVMGYAGWNDIVSGTATTILEHHQSDRPPEVMWAFHESEQKVKFDGPNPNTACGRVLASFANPIASTRSTFYCGVNLHSHLPEVVDTLSPHGADGLSGGAGKPSSSLALVPHLEALVAVVPKRYQPEFQALLDDAKQSKPVGLVGVVALCCMVLEDAPKDVSLRMSFGEAAWDLINCMVGGLVDSLGHQPAAMATKPGEVIRVPAKTHFMVALLLAKKTHARNLLLPGPKGAISRDDLSLATRSIPFEAGPAEPDRMFQFETLVWKAIFPSEPGYALGSRESPCRENPCVRDTCKHECNRQDLYDRLGADAEKGHRHFLMINPGSGAAWKDIAAKAKEIVFVEPDGSATTGIDEGRLAFLISDFLKLTSKENP